MHRDLRSPDHSAAEQPSFRVSGKHICVGCELSVEARKWPQDSVWFLFYFLVDKPVEDCPFGIRRPMFISPTPDNGDRINVLPYEDVSFTVTSVSAGER